MRYIECNICQRAYPEGKPVHKCTCGGFFGYSTFPKLEKSRIEKRLPGIWRFRHAFDLENNAPIVSLGEGNTPLLATEINHHPVYLKIEGQNPTGSFKDRGTAVLMSFLLSRGVQRAVEDSSGNAGASFAAYAGLTGMKASIYAPDTTSGPKRKQIEAYGAEVILIPGQRSKAAEAVLRAVQAGEVYASHAYMPFGLTGIATIAYEIVESLGHAPGTLIAPVGHGGLLYGIMLGFENLRQVGLIDKIPEFIGVQPKNCSPLTTSFLTGELQVRTFSSIATIAEGTSVVAPVNATAILKRLYSGMGKMIAVEESSIISAYKYLATRGYYSEPTSALAISPLLNDKIEYTEPVVSILTSSGLKANYNLN